MAKKQAYDIRPSCIYCKYSGDPYNYMVNCEYQKYPVPANWMCDIGKFEIDMKTIKIKISEKLIWIIDDMRGAHPLRYSFTCKVIRECARVSDFLAWIYLFVKVMEIHGYTRERISESIRETYR